METECTEMSLGGVCVIDARIRCEDGRHFVDGARIRNGRIELGISSKKLLSKFGHLDEPAEEPRSQEAKCAQTVL